MSSAWRTQHHAQTHKQQEHLMSRIAQTNPAPSESNTFQFVEKFDDQEDFYDKMQEDVELELLRQGHSVRRTPRLYDER